MIQYLRKLKLMFVSVKCDMGIHNFKLEDKRFMEVFGTETRRCGNPLCNRHEFFHEIQKVWLPVDAGKFTVDFRKQINKKLKKIYKEIDKEGHFYSEK